MPQLRKTAGLCDAGCKHLLYQHSAMSVHWWSQLIQSQFCGLPVHLSSPLVPINAFHGGGFSIKSHLCTLTSDTLALSFWHFVLLHSFAHHQNWPTLKLLCKLHFWSAERHFGNCHLTPTFAVVRRQFRLLTTSITVLFSPLSSCYQQSIDALLVRTRENPCTFRLLSKWSEWSVQGVQLLKRVYRRVMFMFTLSLVWEKA